MRLLNAHAGVVLFVLALAGCRPSPRITPLEQQASDAIGISDPFRFHIDGEPTDVQSPGESALTWITATKLALSHDPRIQIAFARVRQSQAEAGQQRLLPNPVVEFSVRFPERGGQSIIDAGITAELLSLIRKPGLVSAADSRLRASYAEAMAAVLDVVAEIQKNYVSAQALDARLVVLQARRAILQQLVEVSQSRVRAGEAPRLDALSVQAELASLNTELIELRADQRESRIALARGVGSPSGAAEWALDPWNAPQPAGAKVAQLITLAMQRRPESQAQIWELEALGEEVKLTRLSPLDGATIGATAERDGDWSVGPAVSVPLPIFDFGQEQRNAAQAKRIEARHRLTQIQRQIVQEVRQASVRYASAQAALDAVESELLPLQQQRREQAEDAYRLGFSDITAVQLAEQDLQASISKRIELQEKLSTARIELERAVGGSAVAASADPTSAPSTQPNN